MKPVKIITKTDLVKLLMQVRTATPAKILAETVVKMNKTDNPYYDKIRKTQLSNVFINFKYENSVNNALLKEGKTDNFVAKERSWGVRVVGTPLVLHNNQYYLETRFLNNEPKISYSMGNVDIDKSVFENFLVKKSPSKTQGLEKEVILRDFSIDNIKEITFNNNHYIVR